MFQSTAVRDAKCLMTLLFSWVQRQKALVFLGSPHTLPEKDLLGLSPTHQHPAQLLQWKNRPFLPLHSETIGVRYVHTVCFGISYSGLILIRFRGLKVHGNELNVLMHLSFHFSIAQKELILYIPRLLCNVD